MTDNCTHNYKLDSESLGKCIKCGIEIQFDKNNKFVLPNYIHTKSDIWRKTKRDMSNSSSYL